MSGGATRSESVNDIGLPLAKDIMSGAAEIAEYLFGDASEPNKRRVYHAADKLGLPTFRLGGTLCARKSTIVKWIETQENAA